MAALVPVLLPSFTVLISLVTNSVRSPHTKRAYQSAIAEFLSWCHSSGASGFTKATVQQYRTGLEARNLSPSSVKIQMSAIRRLAAEMADNVLLDPQVALGIAKVRGPSRRGVRLGNWLSLQQAEELLSLPDTATMKGRRDRALLSVLLGAGLRRAEAASLTMKHIQQREGRWVVADLVGKHDRIRTVPIPNWCKAAIDYWTEAAQIASGHVFVPVNKAGRITGTGLTPESIFHIVKEYSGLLGTPISPHDARRTFAKLAHQGRAGLEQIQLSLGHESIVTTEQYLGVRQDLTDAPCDHLGIHIGPAT